MQEVKVNCHTFSRNHFAIFYFCGLYMTMGILLGYLCVSFSNLSLGEARGRVCWKFVLACCTENGNVVGGLIVVYMSDHSGNLNESLRFMD